MLEQYYNNYNENERLEKDNVHTIEYETTLHFLKKYLKDAITVLDCCAGCGVYAFPLAEQGYEVTAGDLISKHIDIINASEKRSLLKGVYIGNVLDMSRFTDGSFDAVICLGALYHLQTEVEREICVKECLRVLEPNGIFAFSYINRNAIFINHFKHNPSGNEEGENIMKYGKNGIFYGMAFGEANNLAVKYGLVKISNVATDGLIYPLYDEINSLDSEKFGDYLKYHIATCEEPSIIGHSMHGLWIGRKL
jgi:SAM-dependent methyltransferase